MTYNLYWTAQGPTSMGAYLGVLEPEALHFFSTLKALIECPEFLPEGTHSNPSPYSPSG